VDPSLVLSTAARIVGARDDLAAHIGGGHMLLVLDNLEQVTAVGPQIAALLATCPNLTVLATSREPLHLEAEREYPLSSLSDVDAVTLFIERARAVRPDFSADGEVAQICQRLDGLPLAIELAAARVKALSPRGILERLDLRLPLLTGGARDLPERQRTLTATIAWSYDLLSENGRRLFRELGIFAGGSTLEAAEAVCEADLDALTSLIDKSLLRREGERYVMLETIREYALGRLAATDRLESVSRLHANYYLALAGRIDSQLGGSMSPSAHEQVDQEQDNWRTAIRGALDRGDRRLALELVVALQQFWVKHGHLGEGLSWLSAALPLSDAPANSLLEAQAYQLACEIHLRAGDLIQSRIHCESGLSLARETGDHHLIAWLHSDLALLSQFDGVEDATAHFDRARELFASAGDSHGAASVLNNWAYVEAAQGRLNRAVELVTQAIELCRKCTDSGLLAATLHTSGTTRLRLGDPNSALAAMEEALHTALSAGDNALISECADGIMWALAAQQRWDEAARVMGFAAEFRAAHGIRDWTSSPFGEPYVQSIRQALPAGHLGEAMMRGRTMSPLDVVTLAHAGSLIPL
jgi:predicted ATPase